MELESRGAPSTRGFEQYTHEVYGWAYRLLGRHHDALDVVQDVFLKWNSQCADEAPQRPRGWLRRVTVNLAIDVRRHRQADPVRQRSSLPSIDAVTPAQSLSPPRRDQPGARPPPGADAAGGPADRVEAIDREILRNDIAAAMSRLTDLQGAVLVAKVYDEMTFAEVATELDLAVSTVKTHYLRAVRAVRDRLEPRWGREEL